MSLLTAFSNDPSMQIVLFGLALVVVNAAILRFVFIVSDRS